MRWGWSRCWRRSGCCPRGGEFRRHPERSERSAVGCRHERWREIVNEHHMTAARARRLAGVGPTPGGLVTACTLAGALVGIVNGLTFSGLLLAAERGRTIDDLRGWRVAMWGAVAASDRLDNTILKTIL
jgi:hypothetical protein